MAAHGDDLRYIGALFVGPSEKVDCTVAAATSTELSPGRYIARVRSVVGVATIWLRLDGEDATADYPSTPYEIGGTVADAASVRAQNETLCEFIVRSGAGSPRTISAILNAGTCALVLTKVSRDKA